MTVIEPWTCPACHGIISTPYCPQCGERPLRARDLTARGLLGQAIQTFSSVDGRLLRSFRYLTTRPGALTLAYLEGRRKPYIAPLQLFLVANVLFFAMQSATGMRILSTSLNSHLHNQMWSDVSNRLVTQRLASLRTTFDLYAPIFDRAVALNAKSLVILMVLPFAVLPAILFYRGRRPLAAHVVFSLHVHAFLLLLFCVMLVIVAIDVLLGGPGLDSTRVDHAVSFLWLALCAVYLYLATGTVYGARGAPRVLKVVALVAAIGCIVLGYRFAVFLITLYSA